MTNGQRCGFCDWPAALVQVGDAKRCRDIDACAKRARLNKAGRPPSSGCRCAVWPCPCTCHYPHGVIAS